MEVQLAANSALGPDGVGAAMTAQDEPFHSSSSGAGPVPCCPTLTQKDAFRQDTPFRMPSVTVGVLPMVQFEALTVAGTVMGG